MLCYDFFCERRRIELAHRICDIARIIDYIEDHLDGKLDLETIAQAVHYSKYHLHRQFTGALGITIHDYVLRRQLTEAAKLLVFSDKPIIEMFNDIVLPEIVY